MAERAHWKSRFGFILAAAGSAVGLGNIWKFPYITGENGGGLFVLIYLVCILVVGLPIMMAEVLIGRAAQKQPVLAFEELQGRKTAWTSVGWMGVLTGFIILSYYAVVAGWAMDFTLKSVVNFAAPIHDSADVVGMTARASENVDQLRDELVDREVDRASRVQANHLSMRLAPSEWEQYRKFQTVVDRVDDKDLARDRLFSKPGMEETVEQAEDIEGEIAALQAGIRSKVASEFAQLAEVEILDQAEDVKRRKAVFEQVQAAFLATAKDGKTSLFWAALFMVITIIIVAAGVSNGIERACQFLMPTLLALIVIMVGYGMTLPGFQQGFEFVFRPDPTKLKPSGVLEALGHAFFTLSLGMGAMITYGSYQQSNKGLLQESLWVVLFDTLIALLACLMIFPIIFSYGQEPSAGPGLVFMSMPLAFSEIGQGGMVLAIMFFGLLFFAALTSAISLLEVVASYFIDKLGWSRPKAAWITGLAIFLFGVPSAFAMDAGLALPGWETGYKLNFFDTMDYLASNWMLPLGGLFIALYVGWAMPAQLKRAQTEDLPEPLYLAWMLMLRVVTPALVVLVLCQKVGIINIDDLWTLSL